MIADDLEKRPVILLLQSTYYANSLLTVSAFYRVFIGGIALTLYLLISKKRFDFNRTVWFFLFMASIFFAADLWFWHRSVIYVGPGLGTLLANMQVFIMMMAGIFLYKQIPTKVQLFSVPFAVIGLSMIVGLDWKELKPNYQAGIIFGLLVYGEIPDIFTIIGAIIIVSSGIFIFRYSYK